MTETELIRRLDKLERDNRRLKGFALGVVVLAAAVIAIYASQPAPNKIVAHELEVVNESGIPRVIIDPGFVKLLDSKGNTSIELVAENVFLYKRKISELGPSLSLYGPKGKLSARLQGTDLMLYDARQEAAVRLGYTFGMPTLSLGPPDEAGISMTVEPGDLPQIELSDARGFSMDLGSTVTESATTGETQKTSAASIVMFGNGKDHHVIWQAP